MSKFLSCEFGQQSQVWQWWFQLSRFHCKINAAPFSALSNQWQLEAIQVTRLKLYVGSCTHDLPISGAMPCPWTLATVLGSCCMVALVRWFLWLAFLGSPVARGSCRAHYTRSRNQNMSSCLLIMFVWIHCQGLIGKFGQVPLSDICAYVELPNGKVRKIEFIFKFQCLCYIIGMIL